jgi:hypothetical protein
LIQKQGVEVEILIKVIRWIFGLFVLMMGLGALGFETKIPALIIILGAAILIPPTGARIGKLISPLSGHGAAVGAGLGLFFVGLVWGAISSVMTERRDAAPIVAAPASKVSDAAPTPPGGQASATTVAPAANPPPKAEPAAPPRPAWEGKFSEDAAFLIEGEGWDKTRREWGADWIRRINEAMPKAVKKAAASPECDFAEMAGISDRSTPRKEMVFYVDCRNGKRFYISQSDLESEAVVVSKNAQTAAISDSAAIEACEKSVKRQLNNPLTFDRDILNTSVYRAPTGNIAVTFTFQAKNSFGGELPHRARCVIDDQGISPAEITNQ